MNDAPASPAKALTVTGHSLEDLISVVDAGRQKEPELAAPTETKPTGDFTLGQLVEQSDVSVRLANCMARNDSSLSELTVRDALAHPDAFIAACRSTRSMGAKTIDELKSLIDSYATGIIELRAPAAAELPTVAQFTGELTVADALRGRDVSVRLTNALQASEQLRTYRLEDYVREPDMFVRLLRSLKSVGRETVAELTDILDEVVDFIRASMPAAEALVSAIEAMNLRLAGETPEERCRELIDRLDERQRHVITRRYGLDGAEPETLEELGTRNGVTRERVRQIEAKAIRQLGDTARKAEFQRLVDHMSEHQWSALSGGEMTLTEADIAARKRTLDPLFSLAVDLCHEGLEGWIERIAKRAGGGWLRAASDGQDQLADTLRMLDDIEKRMPWPQPIDVVASACETDGLQVAQAARLHPKAQVLEGYVNFGYTGPTARRTIGLHQATRGLPTLFDVHALLREYRLQQPQDDADERPIMKELVETPHLFGELFDNIWYSLPVLESATVESIPHFLGASSDEDSDDASLRSLMVSILRRQGPTRMRDLVRQVEQEAGGRYALASVGAVLQQYSCFRKAGHGVYDVYSDIVSGAPAGVILPAMASSKQVQAYVLARRSGAPLRLFPFWDEAFEAALCDWARSGASTELYRSLLSVSEPMAWPVSDRDRAHWDELKRTHGAWCLDKDALKPDIMQVLPDVSRIMSFLVQATLFPTTGWVQANRVFGAIINGPQGFTALAIMVAAGVVEPEGDWLDPHHPTKRARELRDLAEQQLRQGQKLSWASGVGAIILGEARHFKDNGGWVRKDDLAHLLVEEGAGMRRAGWGRRKNEQGDEVEDFLGSDEFDSLFS